MVQKQFSTRTIIFCHDSGGEYCVNELIDFLDMVAPFTRSLDSPVQIYTAERKHWHILDTVDHFLSLHRFWSVSGVRTFWQQLISPQSYVHSFFFGCHPIKGFMVKFLITHFLFNRLCPSLVEVLSLVHALLSMFSRAMALLNEYRCYDLVTKKLHVSCHVIFLEHHLYFSFPPTTTPVSKVNLIPIDSFASDMPSQKYTSTVEVYMIFPLLFLHSLGLLSSHCISLSWIFSAPASQLYYHLVCFFRLWSVWLPLSYLWSLSTGKIWFS